MGTSQIKSVEDFIEQIPKFPSELLELNESSLKLLKLVYSRAKILPKYFQEGKIKPPLIISYHPKASLLNNNVHEAWFAEKIADKLGMLPIWIPYIYDTGFKNASEKIRRPTYVLFENTYIPLRSSAAISGNIIATEKRITDKEVKQFFRELEKHELSVLTEFKTMLNQFNFGHFLFDLKKKSSSVSKKSLRKTLNQFQNTWLKAVKGTKKLDESLAKISLSLLNKLGIDLGLVMMDDIIGDLVSEIFKEVLECPSIKEDPSLLENLFLAYEIKTRDRTPIMYAGQGNFIAYDDNAVRKFDGNLEILVEGLRNHTVLPTGDLIMLLFTAIGCKLVLGGAHTIEYYPDYCKKSYTLLKETSFNSKMQLLSYGRIRTLDLRNMTDMMSAIRIFDKVGSRNYIRKGKFTIPADIVDHLNFLAGSEEIPLEYQDLLAKILKNQKSTRDPAIEKEKKRYNKVMEISKKEAEELLKDPSTLKKWLRGVKFDNLHPVRLEVLLENLRLDVEMRMNKLEQNIKFEQHILGGTLYDPQEGEILYDGLLLRSHRYPSLFEMVFYEASLSPHFNNGGILKNHPSEWIWKQFIQEKDKKKWEEKAFSYYEDVFKELIPYDLIIPSLQFKNL